MMLVHHKSKRISLHNWSSLCAYEIALISNFTLIFTSTQQNFSQSKVQLNDNHEVVHFTLPIGRLFVSPNGEPWGKSYSTRVFMFENSIKNSTMKCSESLNYHRKSAYLNNDFKKSHQNTKNRMNYDL